jgi:hypothetical protein
MPPELALVLLCNGCMHKTSFLITMMNLVFVALLAKLALMVKNQIPVGYEDESGFHYGNK